MADNGQENQDKSNNPADTILANVGVTLLVLLLGIFLGVILMGLVHDVGFLHDEKIQTMTSCTEQLAKCEKLTTESERVLRQSLDREGRLHRALWIVRPNGVDMECVGKAQRHADENIERLLLRYHLCLSQKMSEIMVDRN
ncbi:MAG TPA: hypothetical protein VFQ60_01395 [Patescibacteria group bacterium]|nr:hypothetical protein [Patescibacteria group bacterium]